MFRSNEDMDASGDAGLTLNEAISFEWGRRHQRSVRSAALHRRAGAGLLAW